MQEKSAFGAAIEYWTDAWQRSLLTLATLNERGNVYLAQEAKEVPNVLSFDAELVLDGRSLTRPVNYALVRIIPPSDIKVDLSKPPIVVVDPRAGHGPGIGGMKPDSEIGVALRAGHTVYFVGFLPKPIPGQTIEDVCRAEAAFLEEVTKRHREADDKPIVIANCQAGWQIMMTVAIRPELAGVVILAGTPLSYWAGVRGKNPMRYLGGALGGTWLTALAGDMGAGIFDGASLVANFEALNPANTFWTKPYNVYSKVDTEQDRFIEFETWWGSPVQLNASEMQWIADNLFVGNKLSTGQIRASDGSRIDLRNIKSPIVVFCSWGDNITPPQQALDWILDLYNDVSEIVANGQTIIYCLHPSIGHLGIFVSGKVAAKEHREFVSCMEMIEVAPPGLYEAVISEADDETENRDLVDGKFLFRLETRTLDDIRAFGVNSAEDERRFATVARVSDINLGLYETFVAPWVRATITPPMAEVMRELHPNRLRFALFSDKNPLMQPIKAMAEDARQRRTPVSDSNPWRVMEKTGSDFIASSLERWGEIRDSMTEGAFLNVYGSRSLQAAVGLNGQKNASEHQQDRNLGRDAAAADLYSRLNDRFDVGGVEQAVLRAAVYVRKPDGAMDERGYRMLKIISDARKSNERVNLSRFREMLHEQLQLLLVDEERAIAALPTLLNREKERVAVAWKAFRQIVEAAGELSPEGRRRFARVEKLFGEQPTRVKATDV